MLDLDPGQSDTLALASSDGVSSWHLRWSPDDISFYGADDRYPVDATAWHTWRLAMSDDLLTVCMDDTQRWSSPPSFSYARKAMWVGDDGSGTGGVPDTSW